VHITFKKITPVPIKLFSAKSYKM